jgi:hypothetical protein
MALEALTAQLPEIKRLWLKGLSAADIAQELGDIKLTSSIKRAIQQMKAGELSVKISLKDISSRSDPSRTAKAQEADRAYSKLKGEYSQELLDKTDEFTKNPKYKNLSQVENALYKHFNKSKYTLAPAGVPNRELTAFFRPADKIFNIPENFKIYGGEFGKRKLREKQTALRQLIGTKFFANSTLPKYDGLREAMVKFYSIPETKREDLGTPVKNAIRKFNKDFSISTAVTRGSQAGIVNRFFDEKGFDFSKKIKDWRKIWTTKEGLQDLLKTPNLSEADRAFYKRELDKLNKTDRGLLKALKEKFPAMFKKDAAGGTMQLEHRVARALGETGDMKLPKDYIARASYVPGRFNQAKFEMYDKPLFELIAKYNSGDNSAKSKILELTKDFNKRSKGFLDNVNFKWGDKVQMTDSTPLFTKRSDVNILKDIDKNIKSSQAYFKSLGSERIPGMPAGTVASDFVAGGSDVKAFQKLVRAVENAPQACRRILNYQTGGISTSCAVAIQEDPIGSANKLKDLKAESGPLAKVKNAATGFLGFAKKGGKYGAIAAAGAAGAGLVKTFVNDDPTTYLSNEDQQKNLLISMVTDPIDETPPEDPAVLDYQLPTLGAVTVAGMVPGGKRLYDVRRRGGPKLKPAGPVRSALGLRGVLGKGLAATATPLGLAALEPLHIAGQIAQGDSLTDIAINPLNYLGAAFASPLTKEATKFASPMASKIMRMGLSPTALRGLSRFGGYGLAASLGIQGLQKFDDWRNKRGWFSEE